MKEDQNLALNVHRELTVNVKGHLSAVPVPEELIMKKEAWLVLNDVKSVPLEPTMIKKDLTLGEIVLYVPKEHTENTKGVKMNLIAYPVPEELTVAKKA